MHSNPHQHRPDISRNTWIDPSKMHHQRVCCARDVYLSTKILVSYDFFEV